MKKLSRILALVIAICMIMAFASCNNPGEGGKTTEENKTQAPGSQTTKEPEGSKEEPSGSESGSAATPVDSDTESDSESESDTETEEPGPAAQEIPDGTMIYFEDFNGYGDKLDTESTLTALRANGIWRIDTTDDPLYPNSIPYADVHTTNYSIENGKLVIRNFKTAGGEDIEGKDAYMVIVDENTLWELDGKDYTIQYDIKYESAGNVKRYIAMLWNYFGQCYHSFHFRIAGNANFQTHFYGAWHTMDMYDPATDLFAASEDTEAKPGSSICKKLLGKNFDSKEYTFTNVDLTIKIQVRAVDGPIVWMRVNGGAPAGTTAAEGFVKVCEMVPGTAGYADWGSFNEECHGGSLVLKTGAKINGTVDNIMVWSGLVDEPADHIVTFQPTPLQ